MLLQARLVPEEQDDRRAGERQPINQPSTLRNDSEAGDVYVRDLSETGFSVATDMRLALGSTVTIGLPGHGRATARVVRQVTGGYGCEFTEALGRAEMLQTFRGGTVIQMSTSEPMVAPLPEPEIKRFPGAVRVGVIVGASGLLWAAILRAVSALF